MTDTAYQVMWDRYTGAFVSEMQAFADAVIQDHQPPVTGMDGLYPVLMAVAAAGLCRSTGPSPSAKWSNPYLQQTH